MEATKKKKAYIKPRMEKFEMKMENTFMSTSRPVLEENDEVKFACFNIKNNSWVDLGGGWNALFKDETGTKTVVTTVSKLESHANDVYKAGFENNDCVEIRRSINDECTSGNADEVTIIIKLLNRGSGSCY